MDAIQLSILPLAPIYHVSLTCVWEECPTCHARNNLSERHYSKASDNYYTIEKTHCPDCGQLLNWDADAIEAACKYSKDYPRQKA